MCSPLMRRSCAGFNNHSKPNLLDASALTDIQRELAAMQMVADALAGLSDAAAGARVPVERFAAADFCPAASVPEPAARVLTIVRRVQDSDPSIDIEEIQRLFHPDPHRPVSTATEQPAGR